MSRLSRETIRGLKETERDLGKPTLTWGGNPYVCSTNVSTQSKILGLGGEALNADLVLFVRKAVLTRGEPEETQVVTFKDREYRITKKSVLPGGDDIVLICNDASEGN